MTDSISTRATATPTSRSGIQATRLDRPTARALLTEERRTVIRAAGVQGHGYVQVQKMHEIDNLAREAVTGHAMLRKWADTVASGDPFLADELKFLTDVARIGKGEIIADTVSDFCQEGRR